MVIDMKIIEFIVGGDVLQLGNCVLRFVIWCSKSKFYSTISTKEIQKMQLKKLESASNKNASYSISTYSRKVWDVEGPQSSLFHVFNFLHYNTNGFKYFLAVDCTLYDSVFWIDNG